MAIFLAPISIAEAQDELVGENQNEFSVSEFKELESPKGLTRYQFSVDVPKGRLFRVTLGEKPTREYAPASFIFEQERDEPATVVLSLSHRHKFLGDRSQTVLLAKVDDMNIKLDAEGCHPGGLSTITGVPLGNVARNEKQITIVKPNSPLYKTDRGYRLLMLTKQNETPETTDALKKVPAHGELTVSLEPIPVEKKSTPLEDLVKLWRKTDIKNIGTAEIQYTRFRIGPTRFKAMPCEEVHRLIELSQMQEHPDRAIRLVRKLLNEKGLEFWKPDWGKHTFRVVGNKTYHESFIDGEIYRKYFFDGDLEISYDLKNNQVNVCMAGQSYESNASLSEFVHSFPTTFLAKLDDGTFETEMLEDQRLAIRHVALEMVIDQSSGLVERFSTKNGPHVDREVFRFKPTQHVGGFATPELILNFEYKANKLRDMEVILISNCTLNELFPPESFRLSIPAGAKFFDSRENPRRPKFHRNSEAVDDVAKYIRVRDNSE